MIMSREFGESLTRQEAEAQINRRLKISRWFTRAMFAVGIGSGLVIANTPADSQDQGAAESAVIVAGVGTAAAAVERVRAYRSARKTILNFGLSQATEHGVFTNPDLITGLVVTDLKVEDGDLIEEPRLDYRAIAADNKPDTMATAIGPFIGSLGVGTIGKWATGEIPASVDESTVNGLGLIGVSMLGGAVAAFITSEHQLAKKNEAYTRQIENIEGGLSFRAE